MAGAHAGRPGRITHAAARTAEPPRTARARRRPPGQPARTERPGPAGLAGRALVPLIPAALGLAAGAYRLGVPPLWRDEAATKAIASRTAGQILATLPHDDVVHGAYYLVVHVFITLLGSSNAALRLPSALAMAVACGFTALVGQRLAAGGGRWQAACTGVAAGSIFAVLPATVRYAQEARSYAIVTMLAVIATYLLLLAADDGRPRRWAWYGAAAFLTGLFNVFGLLIVAAHGVSLAVTRRPARPAASAGSGTAAGTGPRGTGPAGTWPRGTTMAGTGPGGRRAARDLPVIGVPAGWLAAAAAGSVLLAPVVITAYGQRNALSWLSSSVPVRRDLIALTRLWTGTHGLTVAVFGLAALGVAVAVIADRRAPSAATVALPWLAVPPAVLLAVSMSHPVYDQRYVEFCLPPLAICAASGSVAVWRGLARAAAGRRWVPWLGAACAAAAGAALVIALQPADAVVREPGYRPDNLELEARIIAANEKPGDIVFFIPINDRIVSEPFPGPWRGLRDIALATTPTASNTLYGTDVSPAGLLRRFTRVTRVWVVSSSEVDYMDSAKATPLDREEAGLIHAMRQVRRWRDSDTELTLYAPR